MDVISKIKRVNNETKDLLLFMIFVVTLFAKTMIFHLVCFHSVAISALWNAPMEFYMFWGGKIAPILFLGGLFFLTKNRLWTIILNFLLDIWIIANLFYFKANGLFLSIEVIFLVDNLDGFWDSLYTYMSWDMLWYVFISFCYLSIYLIFSTNSKRNVIVSVAMIFVSLLVSVGNNYCYKKWWGSSNYTHYYYPFGSIYYWAKVETCGDYNVFVKTYTKHNSIISLFPASILYHLWSSHSGEIIQLTQEDLNTISRFCNTKDKTSYIAPKYNIIYILFESLESWAIEPICGIEYLPNLRRLSMSDKCLYVPHIVSQTKHGNSADGQMIGVTGLLPIFNGATCHLYGTNKFPNYAHLYDNSAIFNPSPEMWRQTTVTKSYEFKELIEPEVGDHWTDAVLLNKLQEFVIDNDSNYCVLGITIDSHVPFKKGKTNPKYVLKDMPETMSAYLNSLCYTDSCIGAFLDVILESPKAKNTIIIITGDHTCFRNETGFEDMNDYADKYSISFKSGSTFTPLLIYIPELNNNVRINDICYQMDIYPTIMHLIDCEDYYWKGFGVNLLDSVARDNRPILESDAFILSDKIIRSDYFRQYAND